jgi:hypothetical protein
MEHAFTTEAQNAGVWFTRGREVYCRWQWDQGARQLIVEAGDVTRSWTTPKLDHSGESGIHLDLPETAKDVAQLIERQAQTTSCQGI